MVLNLKKGSGMQARARVGDPSLGGTAWARMSGAPQALLLAAGSPREQKLNSALPTAPSCGAWDPVGPRAELNPGGSPGFGGHPCRTPAYRLPRSPLPRLPAFLAPGARE